MSAFGLAIWATSLVVPGTILIRSLSWRHSWILAVTLSFACLYFVGLALSVVLKQFNLLTMAVGVAFLTLLFASVRVRTESIKPRDIIHYRDSIRFPQWLVWGLVIVGFIFVWKAWADPLAGADTFFRWNLLPQLLVHTENLSYYPPVDQTDFSLYFFPDKIASWVAIHYAWFYSCVGVVDPHGLSHLLVLVAILTIAATACSAPLGMPGSPVLVTLLLITSPWIFWGITIGQETGWIVLGVATTAYAWSRGREKTDWRSALVPACTIQAAVQAREYGPAFIVVGLLLGLLYGANRRQIIVFTLAASAALVPWQGYLASRDGLALPFVEGWNSSPQELLISGYFKHLQNQHALWNRSPRELVTVLWFLLKGGLPVLIGAVSVFLYAPPRPRTGLWLAAFFNYFRPMGLGARIYLRWTCLRGSRDMPDLDYSRLGLPPL